MDIKKNTVGKWSMTLKVLLMLLSFFLIYYQLKNGQVKSGMAMIREQLSASSQTREYIYILLFLMPVNWILETLKWKLLTDNFFPQRFISALRGVLAGVAISFFTPNRSGDFAGRILHLPAAHRINGTIHSFAGSIAQVMVTLTAGVFSLLLMFDKIFDVNDYLRILIYITLPASVIGFHILFFRLPVFGDYLAHLKHNIKWLNRLSSINHIERLLLAKVYALSILRYSVFTLQFYLLLIAFSPVYAVWVVPVLIMTSFLFISLIPSFALGEIGIRGSVCIFLFTALGFNGPEVLIASTGIWVINIVIPAVAGAISMLYFKLGS
jgi:hypothetical protein